MILFNVLFRHIRVAGIYFVNLCSNKFAKCTHAARMREKPRETILGSPRHSYDFIGFHTISYDFT